MAYLAELFESGTVVYIRDDLLYVKHVVDFRSNTLCATYILYRKWG